MRKFLKKHRFEKHLTQISTFFIAVMATLIVITFVTIQIGKQALDKTYAGNAADAGAISGASVMAYAFNYAANANAGDDESLTTNWDAIEETYTKHFDNALDSILPMYDMMAEMAYSQTCTICTNCTSIAQTAKEFANEASKEANNFSDEMDELLKDGFHEASADEDQHTGTDWGVVPNGAHLQQAFLEAIRERVHDDQDGQNDLYQNALATGYLFNFASSGTSHRLGKINQKRYSSFLEEITPEKIRNGEAKTFAWVDGAGRAHTVTAMITINPARTYRLKTTQDDRETIDEYLDNAREEAANAREYAGEENANSERTQGSAASGLSAEKEYELAQICCDCTKPCLFPCDLSGEAPLCCPDQDIAGDLMIDQADIEMTLAEFDAQDAQSGLDGETEQTTSNKDGSEPYIIKKIMDIEHNRQVSSYNFQFHMGGPVKGGRGDVDVPTFYIPVTGSAIASFRGNGDIENGQASHDASLMSAN